MKESKNANLELTKTINELQNEKASLMTTLSLMSTDIKAGNANKGNNSQAEVTEPNEVEPGAQWTKVARKNNKGAKDKGAQNRQINTKCNRQTQINQPSQQRTTTEQRLPEEEVEPLNNTDRRSTVIIGDSVISGLKGWRMSDKNNIVRVRSFPGATIDDMNDYIKPTTRAQPDNLIIHIGTNNLPSDEPRAIAEKMSKLVGSFQRDSPDSNIVISELAPCKDSGELNSKAKSVNKLLRSVCTTRSWTYLEHRFDTESKPQRAAS